MKFIKLTVSDFTEFQDNSIEHCSGYGKNLFTYDGYQGIQIEDMKNKFEEIWEEYKECTPDYMQNLTSEEFFQCFDPEDIVDDAGAWDSSDFRMFFSDYIYSGEPAILLTDGAIVFDESLAMAH